MDNDQYATPVVVHDSGTTILQRVPFKERLFDEDWLQELLYQNPTILPLSYLEPAFSGSIPIVRELPTGAGPVDLLYMNSKGYITLVETKLWRNPEARRSVVAQIIDYAKDIAGWTYDSFVSAIRTALKDHSSQDPLIDLFLEIEEDDFDKQIFIDRVTRNLQRGRFLLLIVGDGIQEGVKQMADFIQQTPTLGYSLALIELAVFRENPEKSKPLYIQPKILMRTKEIVRAVIELKIPVSPSDVSITLPSETQDRSRVRKRITEEEYFEELAKSSGQSAVQFSKWILEQAEDRGLRIDWKDAGPIIKYDDQDSEAFFTLFQLHKHGILTETYRLHGRFKGIGWPLDAVLDYFNEVASLIPGAVTETFNYKTGKKEERVQIAYGNKPKISSYPLFVDLEPKKIEFFNAIDKLVRRIQKLSGEEE